MKRLIVVGAGVAGLTAAVYALQSGFDVTVLEQHSIPGGFCTAWKRKGYFFEGGMHWLTGSLETCDLNHVWREVGAIDDSTVVHNFDPFFVYSDDEGDICLYRDPEKTQAHLLEIAPEDEKEIRALCRDVRRFNKMQMIVSDIKGLKVKEKQKSSFSMLSMLPLMPGIMKYSNISLKEYAARYSNPRLRLLFEKSLMSNDNAATAMVMTLASGASGDGGYLEGGSIMMAQKMAKKVLSLGGTIKYNTQVDKVNIKEGKVSGVTAGDEQIPADAVIVTRDALSSAAALFEPPLEADWIAKMARSTKPTLDTFICLGIEADLSCLSGKMISLAIDEPIVLGDFQFDMLGICNYSGYDDYAPPGCTAVTVILEGDTYDYWKRLKDEGSYYEEKEKLAKLVIERLSGKIPVIEGKVAVVDVATPLTYERYCGSYKGSWMTVLGKGQPPKSYPCTVDGVNGLYFAGQRIMPPGGLPVAVSTGRTAVQHLCRDNDMVFQVVK